MRLVVFLIALVVFAQAQPGKANEVGDRPIGILLAAGDIANCGSDHAHYVEVAKGLAAEIAKVDAQKIPIRVVALGDLAYQNGSKSYAKCFEDFLTTWGAAADGRLLPIPGNHDYSDDSSPNAGTYFDHFKNFYDGLSVKSSRGSYVYEFPAGAEGAWLLLGYNYYGGRDRELRFLKQASAQMKHQCILAFSHVFYLSSGHHGSLQTNNTLQYDQMRPMVDFLLDRHAEILLSAHDHDYEVFEPFGLGIKPTEGSGVRQFVVGTGGAPLYADNAKVRHKLSQEFQNSDAGFLKLALYRDHYAWSYVTVRDGEFTESETHQSVCW
jgi:hypothetical protein